MNFFVSTTPIAICLSETWMKPIDETCLFEIPGYHKPLNVAKTNKSSAVIIYIDERLSYNPIHIQTSLENITVQITGKHMSKLTLSCDYNSPSLSKVNSLADIDNLLTQLNEHCDKAIVVGDMNFDLLKNSTSENRYRETVQQNGFVQLIKCPTREFKDAVSLVDHVLVKSFYEMYFESDIMKTSITDHYATFAKFSQNLPKEKSIPRIDFSFTKNEKLRNLFISKLRENLTEKFGEQTDMNIATENFLKKKIIQDTMSKFVKLTNNRQKRSKPPWYDNHLKNQTSKRNKLHTRFTRAPTSDNFSKFKHSRKHMKALLKIEKETVLQSTIQKFSRG